MSSMACLFIVCVAKLSHAVIALMVNVYSWSISYLFPDARPLRLWDTAFHRLWTLEAYT